MKEFFIMILEISNATIFDKNFNKNNEKEFKNLKVTNKCNYIYIYIMIILMKIVEILK